MNDKTFLILGRFRLEFFSNPLLITVQLQIEEISRKLRTGDLGISHNLEERFEHMTKRPKLRIETTTIIKL